MKNFVIYDQTGAKLLETDDARKVAHYLSISHDSVQGYLGTHRGCYNRRVPRGKGQRLLVIERRRVLAFQEVDAVTEFAREFHNKAIRSKFRSQAGFPDPTMR